MFLDVSLLAHRESLMSINILEDKTNVLITVHGSATVDIVFLIDSYRVGSKIRAKEFRIAPGGQASNVAATLASLGWPTRFVGCFGGDHYGDRSMAFLQERGCELTYAQTVVGVPHHVSTVITDRSHNSRSIATYRPPTLVMNDEDLRRSLPGSSALYTDGYLSHESIQLAQAAREIGLRVFVDAEEPETLKELCCLAHEVVTPLDIIRRTEGVMDMTEALTKTLSRGPEVVIATDGARGCVGMSRRDHGPFKVPAFPISVVDTTGAGDAFHAGYIAGRLSGLPVKQSAEIGTATAARCCQELGPVASINSLDRLRSTIRQRRA